MRESFLRNLSLLLASAALLAAGCGGGLVSANSADSAVLVTPNLSSIDTNCTGCNATNARGTSVHQFAAKLANGEPAEVNWSVEGGDAAGGAGNINASGQYTPPSYLTADRAEVVVTATLDANPAVKATTVLTVTPGFLQPLTPENVALGANGTVTITGILAETGGTTAIHFALAGSASGSELPGAQGWLGPVNCQRDSKAFTVCTVTYSAPPVVQSTGATYVVASAGGSSSKAASVVLVNSAGITSNPATHQAQEAATVLLGTSGGNNTDYDTRGNQIVDCCSGTLGALVEDANKHQYLLSNNHVLAKSDQGTEGDTIVEPGLIDHNCTPFDDGAGSTSITPVGFLTGWLPLNSKATNADVAIAQVASHTVDASGSILELGAKQSDGTLAAAPPGISSTAGHGETVWLDLKVAKSGRTTGLTCGGVSAVDLDVKVDYFLDCAETRPYLTKTFTHQLAVSGNQFSDSGDSGALIVDAANAEPVGLYFAGGTDSSGVSQGVANPATDVLNELDAQLGGSYTFVGAADHGISCLSYGDNTIASAQGRSLSDAENARAQQALSQARMLVNPSAGVLGVAMGKSTDHAGEAAVILYTGEPLTVSAPAEIDGVRTLLIPTTSHAVAYGSAPQTAVESGIPALPWPALSRAIAVKNQLSASLMSQNPAFFAVGAGQSLDSPKEAALVIYVDRKRLPAHLPAMIGGLRTRYIVMDRLHVTRSYATPEQSQQHCTPHGIPPNSNEDLAPLNLKLD